MSHNILIVDDSSTVRAILKRTIGMTGIAVGTIYEAGDGHQALATLAEHPDIHLVMVDLHMPVMDGVELTRRMLLGNHSRRIPVVVVSAEPNPQKIDQLRKLGIRGHIKKPFTPEMVRDVLTGLLTEVNRAA